MDIKQLNESFHKLYESTCKDCVDELTFDDIEFDPSVEGELDEPIKPGIDLDDYNLDEEDPDYEAHLVRLDLLDDEDLNEGKAFDFDKINKKLHGNIKLKNESLLKEHLSDSETLSIKLISPDNPKRVNSFFKRNLENEVKFTPKIIRDNGDNTYILGLPKKQDWVDLIKGLCDESMLNIDVEVEE